MKKILLRLHRRFILRAVRFWQTRWGERSLIILLAILIGGASVNKASIPNVIIGTILFQGIVTMTPTVLNSLIHMDMSEVIRMIVSNGMILYALTRKTEGSK